MTRYAWLAVLACSGCQSFSPLPPTPAMPVAAPAPSAATAGSPDRKPIDPAAVADFHLGRATALIDQGDEGQAADHLELYLTHRPTHLTARAKLGELRFQQGRLDDSRLQFELFIAMAQEEGESAFRYLIHCHSRLVEIAEAQKDSYEEHLNRGIGLYYLACRRTTEPDPEGELSASSLFCRAAAELQEARAEQPEEARPHFYLYHVWKHLDQDAAARRELDHADQLALLTRLTPLERRILQSACVAEKNPLRSAK